MLIRLNCLSTEFSRTKGVKGIPLRIQVETEDEHNDHEYCYCRVKIFRDKVKQLSQCIYLFIYNFFFLIQGAQRKNRDDQKAVEKKLEKLSRDTTVDKSTLFIYYLSYSPPITTTTPRWENAAGEFRANVCVVCAADTVRDRL